MRHYLPAILAVAAIIGGNGLLWLLRPSAEPAAPQDLFPPAVPTAADNEPAPSATPADPLTLELEPEETLAPTTAAVERNLTDAPHLHLNLNPDSAIRPELDKLELFDPDYGTRGFTSRHWLSEHVGIQGGIGYTTEENAPDDRHLAIGVGLVLTY